MFTFCRTRHHAPKLPGHAYLPEDEAEKQKHNTYLFSLNPVEKPWPSRATLLEEQGYKLRPRYQKQGFIPSFMETNIFYQYCEDCIRLPISAGNVIDARRITDGTLVSIKACDASSHWLACAEFFADGGRRLHPWNHCVPLEDVFHGDQSATVFAVMPHLRPFNDPPLESLGDVIEFVQQTLEFILYMHEEGLAHEYCWEAAGIMMDVRHMYPKGYHPVRTRCLPDGICPISPATSRTKAGVKYYFINLQHATVLPCTEPQGHNTKDILLGGLAREQREAMCRRDLAMLARLYKTQLLDKYELPGFIGELVQVMSEQRLSDDEVLASYLESSSRFPAARLDSKLRNKGDSYLAHVLGSTSALASDFFHTMADHLR